MSVLLAIFLIGFTATAAQIVILRELLIVFYGNEISIGFILGSWLFWGAAGSWFLGRLADKFPAKPALLVTCQIALSFSLVFGILIIRSAKNYLGFAPGQIMGFIPMAFSSFLVLAPVCVLLGFMFSLGCKIYQGGSGDKAQDIGLAYGWESVGAMFGGILTSFIFIRFLNSVDISIILALLNVFAAGWMLFQLKRPAWIFPAVVFFAGIILWGFGAWDRLDDYSRQKQWQGYRVLESSNSIYGNITAAKRAGTYSFFDNGLYLYSVPDIQPSEEAAHFALLEHPDPQNVLLVGGGTGGLIKEILSHPVKRVDYLELDPLIIKMSEKYLPAQYAGYLRNPRVSIYNLDGRFFVRSSHNKYDCIITHLGDPYTAQINRYYTVEFFREVKRALREGGVFSFALSSSESYISPELRQYLKSVYFGLKSVFSDVLVIPGDTAYFIACDKAGLISRDYNVLMQKAKERGLDLKYVRGYYLFSKLSKQMFAYTEMALLQGGPVKMNYDFYPSTYYYGMIFWAARLGEGVFERLLKGIDFEKTLSVLLGVCVFIILAALAYRDKRKRLKYISLTSLAATGFSAMAMQVIVLLSFQIIYGYIFYKIGFLITVFMAGLALGSFYSVKLLRRPVKPLNILIPVNGLFGILSLSIFVLFSWLSISDSGYVFRTGADIILSLLSAVFGLLAGAQFSAVNKIYLEGKPAAAGRISGVTYGADLLGSCFGALLTGVLLIPALGISWSCFFIAAINFSICAALIIGKPRS